MLDPLIVEYEHFKDFFNSKLTIHADLESIINGRPLSWIRDVNQIPMKQLCMSEGGRSELAAFLLHLRQIEERALSLLNPFFDLRQLSDRAKGH